jgi:hypothetical protein
VTVCQPGEARGARTLRNHGLDLLVDPTAWSRHGRTHAFGLTTGGHDPKQCGDGVAVAHLRLLHAIFCELEDPATVPQADQLAVAATNAWILRWRDEARARAAALREVASL